MDNQDIRTLKILEEIENNHSPSQRDLARQLNISLGLVNSFIKGLVNKGYFKVTTIPANRVKYILTPKGVAEKARLTYEYIQYSFQFYKSSRQKLRKLFSNIVAENDRKVIFFGATELAEIAFVSLQEFPLELVAIVDMSKESQVFIGYKVRSPTDLASLSYDRIIITIIKPWEEVVDNLMKLGVSGSKIVMLS